jgi:hypothetical protein
MDQTDQSGGNATVEKGISAKDRSARELDQAMASMRQNLNGLYQMTTRKVTG